MFNWCIWTRRMERFFQLMPSLHAVNMKILKYTPKKVYGYGFGIYTPSAALHSDPCIGLPCQLAITNIMITHPQVQPYSMTLIKTGIVYKREITLNVILVTLKCTCMDPIVFLDNSSFCDKCSQLLCCPTFWNEE